MSNKSFSPIYIVSGGKGIAGHVMIHSLIIQYPDHKIPVEIFPDIHSQEEIEKVVKKAKQNDALICHTLVRTSVRTELIEECRKMGVDTIDFMGPLEGYLEQKYDLKSVEEPGLYRRVNAQYFDRIDAMEYTLTHDDGLDPERIKHAEIILTGVSRSGKTPLSIYMSMFGWKVANVPLVNGIEPPKELFEVDPQKVFGLDIKPNYLIAQRMKRLRQMGGTNDIYVDDKKVIEELRYAKLLFTRGKFTIINTTKKPIESSANEIISLYTERFGNTRKMIPED